MSANQSDPRHEENRILRGLPKSDYARLVPQLTRVTLALRHRVIEPYTPIRDVYFPINCIVSMLTVMKDGTRTEVATVGNEGIVGLPTYLGTLKVPIEAFAQVSGEAWKLPVSAFRRWVAESTGLDRMLRLYTQFLLDQMAQSVSCNRLHSAEQRFCRWMLMVREQIQADSFAMTQEFLGQMMAVRRATVSEVASGLQADGLITYSRGRMKLENPKGMARRACECYAVVKAELDRLLP